MNKLFLLCLLFCFCWFFLYQNQYTEQETNNIEIITSKVSDGAVTTMYQIKVTILYVVTILISHCFVRSNINLRLRRSAIIYFIIKFRPQTARSCIDSNSF